MSNIIVPKSWTDVTVEQFMEIIELFNEEFPSNYLLKLNLLALFNDTSIDDDIFEELYLEELNDYLDNIAWIYDLPRNNFVKEIKIDDKVYINKGFDKISLGEFIDLNSYFLNYHENFTKICSVFYRQQKVDEWGNIIIEPYIFDINVRRDIFNNVPIGNVYGIINDYITKKEIIVDKYTIVFGDDGELIDIEGLSDYEIEEIGREEEEEKKKSVWSWHRIIHRLAGGDVTKYDDVTNMPLTLALNELTMRSIFELD